MSKLYKVLSAGETYGTFLTNDSSGRLILEMKGNNAVRAFLNSEVEEVLPYTVGIKFLTELHSLGGGKTYSYLSKHGDVSVGDIVFADGYANPMVVVAVDTKSDKATVHLRGKKVTPVAFG
jgi:hypothetical protein